MMTSNGITICSVSQNLCFNGVKKSRPTNNFWMICKIYKIGMIPPLFLSVVDVF